MLLSGLGDRLAALFEVVNSLTHAFVSIIAPPLLQPSEGQMNPGAKCVLRRHPFLSAARLPVVARGWLLRRFIHPPSEARGVEVTNLHVLIAYGGGTRVRGSRPPSVCMSVRLSVCYDAN